MKAVGYLKSLPLTDPKALVDFTADKPASGPRDLRVAVKAISVNPVDTKVRMRAEPKAGEPPKVLGFDAAGVVDAVGADVTLFKAGDEVFYAGSIAGPEPTPNSIWSTSASSAESRNPSPSRRRRRCR